MDEDLQTTLESILTAAQDAKQSAAQAVQAISQVMRQSGAESTRSIIDATRTAGPQEIGAEREFEIGKDEVHAGLMADMNHGWHANRSRMFDEYLNIGTRIASQAADHAARIQVIAERQLTNAATHDSDLNAMKVRHNDLAIDRQWNVDEVATLVAKNGVFADAIAAGVAAAVAETVQG